MPCPLSSQLLSTSDAASITISPVLHTQDLLIEMQNAEAHSLDYLALASVLVAGARSGEDAIRATALRWLAVIIAAAKAQLLPLYASILQAILPALSSTHPDILEVGLLLDVRG